MGYQNICLLGLDSNALGKMSSQFDLRIQSVPTLWLGFLKELHCSPLLAMSSCPHGGGGGGGGGGGKGGWGGGDKIKNKKSALKNGT